MDARSFLQALLALALVTSSATATAGRIHPDLERRLAQKATGDLTPVIVELEERVSPSAAAANAPERDRRARGRAVVNALRGVAERTQGPVRAAVAQEQARGEAANVASFWIINGFALGASEGAIRRLAARPDVREVRLDRSIPAPKPRAAVKPKAGGAPAAWNLEQIRAPQVWDLGHSGTGTVVGSFDTGVDGTHPDLAPNYRGNHAISWFDPYHQHAQPYDNHGHGTHTTGTMVASGEASGLRIGVAPGARWIAAKGWNDREDATASAFHAIFQWFLAPGGDPDNAPDVVNSSWGMDPPSCDTEFVADVQALRAAGIVPVFASGNSGPAPATTLAPGSYATSFSVGATDFDDAIAEFSSQGPSQCDGAVKPDVSAPGVAILSTLPGEFHFELDGTSMAAPHVSGAAAVLRSIQPSLTVEEVEAAIVAGAADQGPVGPDNAFGAGRLDLLQSASLVLGVPLVGVEASADASEAGLVPGRFTVRRQGATTSDLVLAYTVGGTAAPGADYVALPGSVTIPAGASSATIAVTPLDDAAAELTETVVVTLAPNPAYIVAPAQASVSISSDELLPDLVVSAFTVPNRAGAGSPLTLNETTRNQGPGPSEASTTGYYISSDSTLDAADTLVGTRAVPALAAGASSIASVTVTLPASLATGSWYLLAKADHAERLFETQEENNATSRSVIVGPDLAITALAAPDTAGAGVAITLSDTTNNAGGGASPASTTGYYLSADGILDASDVLLATRAVPALAAAASHAGSVSAVIPASTGPGNYYVIARADSANAVPETSETNNVSPRAVRIGPDLTISTFTAPDVAGPGSPFTVSDATRNAGGGAAPASTTSYYLSANSVLDASDALVGSRAVAALAPGATDTGSSTVTIPGGTATGTWYLLARADAHSALVEANEQNNTYVRVLRIGPDLTVSALTAPTGAGAGLAIAITDTTRNAGGGMAPDTTTTYYLSTNSVFDAGDVALANRAVPPLAAGASHTGGASATIPAATPAGTYYVIARADDAAAVAETGETNNTYAVMVRVGPDLTVSALTAPAAAGAGATVAITETTRNAGGGPSAASVTRYYLSGDAQLGGTDVVLGARTVPALDPGASDSATVNLAIPPDVAGGTYYLLALADAEGAVAETLETNNTNYRSVVVGSDLVVSALTAPDVAGAGVAITVTDTTRNPGAGAAPASTTAYYLSSNAAFDAADVLLGSRSVAPLGPGASETGSTLVPIPPATATGTWYVIARADAANAVAESNEQNNTYLRVVRIGPDLTVSALTVPATAGAGGTISVTETTRNAGGGAAPASVTRYYLSPDPLASGSDAILGARAVPALGPGASDTATVSFVVPADAPVGYHYVIAVADADGAITEPLETNNTNYRSVLFGPDLVPGVFSIPSAAGAGLPMTVSDTTRNSGGGAAPATTTAYYLSVDATLDAADVLLGSRAVPALAAGASDAAPATLVVPAGTATGTYNVIMVVDADGAVAESYENNNRTARTLRIGPDLTATTITGPASSAAGASIVLGDTTRNAGAGAAPGSVTRYYLSTIPAPSAGDVLLGSRAVPALAAGATDSGTVALTIPAGTASRLWYVVAVADGDGTVPETVETNNYTYRSLTVN